MTGERSVVESLGRAVQSRMYRDGVFGVRPAVPVAPAALERAASAAMSRRAWAYVQGAAGRETTAAANRAALDRHRLLPRVLRDVERRDLSVELLGRRRRSPLLLAPIGVLELVDPRAELAVAPAAADLDVPLVVSSQASHPIEDVAASSPAELWFQLYWSRDDDLVVSFLRRAEAAGCTALVVTLDTHVLGWRPRDLDLAYLPFARGQGIAQYTSDPVFRSLVEARVRRGVTAPGRRPTPEAVRALVSMARRYPGPLRDTLRSPYPRAAVETFLEVFSRSSLTWEHLSFLREHTRLPILLKGIQHPDDARRAVDAGVDGVWVSTHGGRQVDGAVGAADALPAVVEAVDGRVPVVLDSGIRSGSDVLVALALGATAVAVGRPYVYGLALAGRRGVRQVVEHLLAELDLTMGLTGCRDLGEVTAELLAPRPPGA